jgi:hypothetical protein
MRPLPVLLAAALSSACASQEEPDRVGWGRYAEEAPSKPPPLVGAASVPTPSVQPYPGREYTTEEQAFFAEAWSAFKRGDATWPEFKERWMEMGPEASGLLAENLYRAMVASRARGALHLVEEARKDLVLMGDSAVPVLVGGLAVRAVRDSKGEEIRVGQEVLHDAADALSILGPPAVPGLLDIARSGELNLVTEALWALGNIGDPSAEEAILALSRDADYRVRAAAVLALRRYSTEASRARMLEAFDDEESMVAERAAQALVTGKHVEAVRPLVDVLDRAIRDGRILAARASLWALRRLTGEKFDAPEEWRGWLESR